MPIPQDGACPAFQGFFGLHRCVRCKQTLHVIAYKVSGVSRVFHLCAVDEVLCHFRNRFIKEVDSKCIAFDLEHTGIISDAVLMAVNSEAGTTRQNQILYDHLKRTSTRESLTTVCAAMISVSGHPKMNQLGQRMKNMLQGKVGVCMCVHSTPTGIVG